MFTSQMPWENTHLLIPTLKFHYNLILYYTSTYVERVGYHSTTMHAVSFLLDSSDIDILPIDIGVYRTKYITEYQFISGEIRIVYWDVFCLKLFSSFFVTKFPLHISVI
jgi:hypothetical protein